MICLYRNYIKTAIIITAEYTKLESFLNVSFTSWRQTAKKFIYFVKFRCIDQRPKV